MSPFDLLIAIAVVLGWAVIPGATIAAALQMGLDGPAVPTGDEPTERLRPIEGMLASAVVWGYATWMLGAQVVARAIGLNETVAWLGAALLVAASAAWWWRRGRPLLGAIRDSVADLGAPLLAAVAVLVPFGWLWRRTAGTLISSTPWYYWHLAEETARTGRIPGRLAEWGTTVPFLADYPAFTSGTALLIDASRNPASMAPAIVVAGSTVVATVLGGHLLARTLGAVRGLAVASALLLAATELFLIKLSSYRPSAAALPLMLLLPVCFSVYARSRRRADLVAAVVGLATLGQIHGIDFLVGGLMCGAMAGYVFMGEMADRRAVLRRCAVGLVAMVVGWFVVALLIGTDLSGIGKVEDLPRIAAGVDPTWQFQRTSLPGGIVGADPPTVADLVWRALRSGYFQVSGAVYAALIGVALAAVGAWAAFGRRPTRASARGLLAFAALLAAGTVAVCLWFDNSWDTYVPLRTGYQRVVELAVLVVPACLGAAVSLSRIARTRAVTVAVLVAAGFCAARGLHGLADLEREAAPVASVRELRLAAATLPAGSTVLANAYTEGYLPEVLGAEGILDGRAPYTEAGLLERALSSLERGKQFFVDPAAHSSVPSDLGATHVLAADPWVLGTSRSFAVDRAALGRMRGLCRIAGGAGWSLYEVAPCDARR